MVAPWESTAALQKKFGRDFFGRVLMPFQLNALYSRTSASFVLPTLFFLCTRHVSHSTTQRLSLHTGRDISMLFTRCTQRDDGRAGNVPTSDTHSALLSALDLDLPTVACHCMAVILVAMPRVWG